MKYFDRLDFCFRNLTRRKVRTLLTVVGVVVGTCAIVVMISIGIGMKVSQEEMLAQMGDLKLIQVYNYGGSGSGNSLILDDAVVTGWQTLPEVDYATPMFENYEMNWEFSSGSGGRYKLNTSVVGIYPEAFKKLGYELIEGDFLTETVGKNINIVVGEKTAYNFYDSKRSWRNNMVDQMPDANGVIKDPFVDFLKDKIALKLTPNGQDVKPIEKKVVVQGRLKEDFSKNYLTSGGIFMDITEMKKLQEEYRRAGNEKKKEDPGYTQVYVKVKDIKDIEKVEKVIKDAGFQSSSMESIRKPMEQQAKQQQAVLGGLGAISLFVAAIGITNTMIMSIYERTREIGVMKALGCYVKDIKAIFLMEAGCIGLMGGVIGIVISYGISYLLNTFGQNLMNGGNQMFMGDMAGQASKISIIPLWLIVLSLVFSTCIGLISGYYPANRAVKISALEAIRTE